MVRIGMLLVLGLAIIAILAGCAPESSPEEGSDLAAFQGGPDYDYDDLLTALSAAENAQVEEADGAAEAPLTTGLFTEAEVRALRVNQEPVYVYQFENQEAATTAAATVSADAAMVEEMPVDWDGTPHLYAAGRLIVIHVAPQTDADIEVTELLQSTLGAEFAGGPLAAGTPEA